MKTSRQRSRVLRALRYRLLIPMLRARHAPEYAARGTMIGLILAFTPTSGLHTVLVLALWVVASRLFKWEFSLVLALAWTWAANVFTVVPIYYLLDVTGRMMLGHFGDLSGYAEFTGLWRGLNTGDHTLWQNVTLMTKFMLQDWGFAMCLGSLPWAALMGGAGYWLSLSFVRAYRRERSKRRQQGPQLRP